MPSTERKDCPKIGHSLAALIPELGNRETALTSAGLFLVKVGKGAVAVFTGQELRQALRRGRAVLRARAFHRRLQAEREKARQGETSLRRIYAERGFITGDELLAADLGGEHAGGN